MATASEREAAFRKDLAVLLEKHGAEISLEEESIGYYSEYHINVFMGTRYVGDSGEVADESADFDL